jgi:hypothetical protein
VTLLHRLFYLGCLAALLTPFDEAQTISEAEKAAENSSPGGWRGQEDPKAIAWKVHDAMVAHDASAMSELLSLASRWLPLSPQPVSDDSEAREFTMIQKEERDAMTVVLDALIQLNAPVPADTLRKLTPDFENALAVILARMPPEESGPLTQEFFRSTKPGYTLQYVSAALLALHPPSGFAAKLLSDIAVQARVFAVTPGGPEIGFGIFGGSCVEPSEPEREDWPEIGQYKVSIQMSEGALVLVAGSEPIYVSREESTHYLGNECTGGWRGLYFGREQRHALIGEMLGVPAGQIAWETDLQKYIEFISLGQFTGALLAFVEEQQAMYRETAKALEARGLLTHSEMQQSLPQLELNLDDERSVQQDHECGEDSDDECGEDSDDECGEDSDDACSANSGDEGRNELEPISKEAIELPARVVWAEWRF